MQSTPQVLRFSYSCSIRICVLQLSLQCALVLDYIFRTFSFSNDLLLAVLYEVYCCVCNVQVRSK